jgi:ubiquinone biosynthesis protein Coq4
VDPVEIDYLKGGKKPLSTDSSVLVSSSKYLNSAAMRDIVAQEMLRKYGTDLPPAYFIPELQAAFAEVTDYPYILRLLAAERATKPEFDAWLQRGFLSDYKAEPLAACKAGTLGAMVHAFVHESGFDVDFMFKAAPQDDYQYFLKRFIQSHDIQHMVTGFDVTPIGEYALSMVSTATYQNYFSAELAGELTKQTTLQVCCGMMRANLHYPKTMPLMMEAISRGLAMGHQLKKPLFYVNWEDYWQQTPAEIREELNIIGAPAEGEWAWAYEEMKR